MRPAEIEYHARVDAVLDRARARWAAAEEAPPATPPAPEDDEELGDRSWVR